MASSGASVAFGSTVPLGVGNAASLVEAVSNVNIIFHQALEEWGQKFDSLRQFYVLRYEGPRAGLQFTISEDITGSGVAHEIDENAEPWFGDISPGYSKNVEIQELSYALALTWKFTYHNRYPQQEAKIIRGAARSVNLRMEHDMAMPLTYCTSASVTNIDGRSVDVSSGDGLSPANASHTVRNSSALYRNRIVTDPQVSRGAIEMGQNLGTQQIIGNNGQPLYVEFDTILTASDQTTFNTALQLMRSQAPLDAPNPSVYNPQAGTMRVVKCPYIDRTFAVGGKAFTHDSTKQKYWGLIDSRNSGFYLVVTLFPTVEGPTSANGGVDFLTRQQNWVAHGAWTTALLDPRCFVWSAVTTA